MNKTPEHYDAFADFADGISARLARVGVRLEPAAAPDRLHIGLPDGQVLIWPIEDVRQLPDQADRKGLVLSTDDNQVSRLFLEDEPLIKAVRGLARNLHRRKPAENKFRLFKWAIAAVASVALIVLVLVPIMADQLARILPPEGEKALGDTTYENIRMALNETGIAPLKVCETPAGLAAMRKMLTRLNPDDDLPYKIQVNILDHEMVNAFALPGGRIVFFRGLIEAAENPEEVAAVFAHEIGHVVNRDPTRDALRAAGSIGVLGLLFGDFAGGTLILFLANSLVNATYSQKAEAGADTYAHGLMSDAGLSPAALGTMFERLRAKHGDGEGLVAHFAAHPALSDRIKASISAAEGFESTGPVLTAPEWRDLRNICGSSHIVEDPSTPTSPPNIMGDRNGNSSGNNGQFGSGNKLLTAD